MIKHTILGLCLVSCGQKDYVVVHDNAPCTVYEQRDRALVVCPDGSSAVVRYDQNNELRITKKKSRH